MADMDWKAVRETLLCSPRNGYNRLSDADRAELEEYCGAYTAFVDRAKTEREAVEETVEAAKKAGFVEFNPDMQLRPGDRIYCVNRRKYVTFAVIGKLVIFVYILGFVALCILFRLVNDNRTA